MFLAASLLVAGRRKFKKSRGGGTPVELHNTAGDKPTGGKSIFDRTLRVFQPLARTLGGQGFPPKRRVDASVQVHDGRVLRFFSDRTIALFSCLYIDEQNLSFRQAFEEGRCILND